MKQQSRYQILKGLKKKMPEMWFQKSEDWYDDKEQSGSLIVTSEDAKSIIDGIPAFDYYEEATYLAHESVEEFGKNLSSYGGEDMTEEEMKEAHREIERKPTYVFGVHHEIHEFLKERGWIAEWNDSGTLLLSKF